MDIPTATWEEHSTYYINLAPQGGEIWKALHWDRLTMSNLGAVLGLSPFDTPGDIGEYIRGRKRKTRTEEQWRVMRIGLTMEPLVRQWYEKNYQVSVREVGIGIPKWEPRIGGSPDGIPQEKGEDGKGLIEIKVTETLYEPLIRHRKQKAEGVIFSPYYHDHIWGSHYAQMQGEMKILDKAWCDYIVMQADGGDNYVERVLYNSTWWEEKWPLTQLFLDTYLPW